MRPLTALTALLMMTLFLSVPARAEADEESLSLDSELTQDFQLASQQAPQTVEEALPEPEMNEEEAVPDLTRSSVDEPSQSTRLGRRTWRYRQGGPSSIFELE